ncbi:MAG TPA: hypothetical protein VG963_25695 [Polyangiaceae bacterium]|nr:hypothetical protein [Polyangiaceae bacterium]
MSDQSLSSRARCFSVLLGLSLGAALGCRTDSDDVHRWANREQGPRKLAAVMTHDKYPDGLRVEAALTLVAMKPRAGRRVGLDELLSSLGQLPAPSRAKIIAGLVPRLEQELERPAPTQTPGSVHPADVSFPYKDAAFALLTNEGQELISNPADRDRLRTALSDWVLADFAGRMDESSQVYGMGQLLAELGAAGARRLPQLIVPDAPKLGNIAGFIAENGDAATKLEGSRRLVEIAQDVDSDAWLRRKAASLREANRASGQKVEGARFDAQLALYQDEELLRVFACLKQVGGAPALEHLLALARDPKHSEKRREAALAALEGHVDANDAAFVSGLLQLAGADDTPDTVRDQALRRVAELPRQQIIGPLYALFANKNWKVRWVAAGIVLQHSEVQHLAEFMSKLGAIKSMGFAEPTSYGKLIASLPGTPAPGAVIAAYAATTQPVPVRLTALAYYLEQGTREQLALVEPYHADPTRVPECAKNIDGCEWSCEITVNGEQVVKPVQTVGDFVEYCVKPAMQQRASGEARAGDGAVSKR